jgi:Protein of unknown function (DUF2867)
MSLKPSVQLRRKALGSARMKVEECQVPSASAIGRQVVDAACFRDSYRAPLMNRQASVIDIFFGVFGHHPLWMKRVLILRNRIASACGLDAPTRSEIMRPEAKSQYRVGDKIGPWPIFSLTDTELVAGRNNKHLDFRLSVFREISNEAACAVISTVCTTHNTFGKIYLFFVVPFHKWGVQRLILNAALAGRL